MPYPTALLSTAGNQVAATVFYAASLTAVGVAEAAVWLYAIRIRELAMPEATPAVRRWVLLRILRTPVIFLVSIPIALDQPDRSQVPVAVHLRRRVHAAPAGAGGGRAGGPRRRGPRQVMDASHIHPPQPHRPRPPKRNVGPDADRDRPMPFRLGHLVCAREGIEPPTR